MAKPLKSLSSLYIYKICTPCTNNIVLYSVRDRSDLVVIIRIIVVYNINYTYYIIPNNIYSV